MILLKFGGSSVRDAEWITRTIRIAESQLDRAPVLVASAMGKTTDALVGAAESARAGDHAAVVAAVDALEASHEEALRAVGPSAGVEPASPRSLGDAESPVARLRALFQEMRNLLQGVTLIRECSPRTMDALLSFGERLSTLIIYAGAQARGVSCTLHDSRELISTDSNFGAAAPDFPETTRLLRAAVRPRAGELSILQGFIGSDPSGVTTTLGRGGSDYTATIVGAALGAEEVQIWTDVDGIMSADPRIVPEARTLRDISYVEAAELAFFGARVVHPSTIQPAIEHGIPVYVRNTARPDSPGTRITGEFAQRGVRALTLKPGITVITVNSYRMLNAYGFLSRIFGVFARHQVSVDLVATSEVSVSTTVDTPHDITGVVRDLEEHGQVTVEREKAILSLVGKDLWKDTGVLARVFQTLEGIQVRLISLGSSDTNLSLVVSQGNGVDAMRRLHDAFFSPE
ncbi:MAG: aspartate kinase [Spirochaetaceae bacterium]